LKLIGKRTVETDRKRTVEADRVRTGITLRRTS
jgi:hypothetical protein